jgi:hypothetical protein
MDLRKIGSEDMNHAEQVQDRIQWQAFLLMRIMSIFCNSVEFIDLLDN